MQGQITLKFLQRHGKKIPHPQEDIMETDCLKFHFIWVKTTEDSCTKNWFHENSRADYS